MSQLKMCNAYVFYAEPFFILYLLTNARFLRLDKLFSLYCYKGRKIWLNVGIVNFFPVDLRSFS